MRLSLKKTSEPSIPQTFASAHSLDGSALDGSAFGTSALDGFVRASSQRSQFMKVLTLVAAVLLLGATTIGARSPSSHTAPSKNPDNPPAAQTSTTTAPAPGQTVTAGAAPLRVMVGKSLLINTTERLKRISVTDPTVADALVVTPTQVLVNGLAPGEVSLLIWDEYERSRSFDLRVDVDVTAASEEIKRIFPDEQIDISPSRSAIVLSGHVTTDDVAKHAGMVASAYSKNVINVLSFGPVGAQEVLLEVKFAEVDRSALTQLGSNFFSTGAGNTIGTVTTGQYGGFSSQSISQTQGQSPPFTATQTIGSVLNMFLFRP